MTLVVRKKRAGSFESIIGLLALSYGDLGGGFGGFQAK